MKFCTTKLPNVREQRQCQWPRGMILKWTVQDAVAPFSKSETRDVMHMAWAQWEAVCGIKTQHVSRGLANVTILSQRIDGQNGVLAEAQLPCGNVSEQTQLWARFDTGEDWTVSGNLGPSMDLLRVAAHELGHSLGMGHAPQGSRNLMAPTVSNIRTPQKWGIEQSVIRYGQPNQTPVDPKLPESIPEFWVQLTDKLKRAGFDPSRL